MTKFSSITEVREYIESVCGDYAEDFDIEGMAQDCTEWKDGALVFTFDEDDNEAFNATLAKYDRSE